MRESDRARDAQERSNSQLRRLLGMGVKILELGEDSLSEGMLRTIGFLARNESIAHTESITHTVLGENKDFGGGWYRGGAESFYQILKIRTSAGVDRYIAFKAIHTIGNIEEKVRSEAIRLAMLNQMNRAPKVYAVSPGTLIKEFLLSDSMRLPQDQIMGDAQRLLEEMLSVGIKPSFGFPKSILGASVQHQNRLKIIDAGSGDFEGPERSRTCTSISRNCSEA